MNIHSIYNKLILVMLAVLAVTFTACSDDDDSPAAVLEAFGPIPALRGGQLTFIGRGLDRINTVVFPEGVEVTNIEVLSHERIKVTVPQNAEVGYVRLLGSGIEITSKTQITYAEPITITKLAPATVKPGEKLTIEGDYLNLITKVIFTGGAEVTSEDFTAWERAKIELVVPLEAQTGIITLADDAAMPIELESKDELQVVLPSVESIADLTDKKPGDAIEVTAQDLDLVEFVELVDGKRIDFTVEDNLLKLTLPEGAVDGEIYMVAYSGVRVPFANLGMRVPTNLVASPATDIKAGDVITITGADMDLVTSVTFPGVEDEVELTSSTATEIKVTMPAVATSGELLLNTASGNTASVDISTLKPAIASYTPATVSAGKEVEITGTNLDLVTKVTFEGDAVVEVTPASATSLTVNVPEIGQTGHVVLTMKNGETVEGPLLTVNTPEYCYIPVLPGDAIIMGTIQGFQVKNADKLTEVKVKGATVQYILQGNSLNIPMPNGTGETALELISSNGSTTYIINVMPAGEYSIFEGPIELTWSDGGRVILPKSAFESISGGSIMKIYFVQGEKWGQIQFNINRIEEGWTHWVFDELGGAYLNTDILNNKAITEQELILTQNVLDDINEKADPTSAVILQGEHFTITKVSIIPKR